MRIVGQVVQLKEVFGWDQRSEEPDRVTLYIRSGTDTIIVVCRRPHIPENVIDKYVQADVRLCEVRIPRYPMTRFEDLYEAENSSSAIIILSRDTARTLDLPE